MGQGQGMVAETTQEQSLLAGLIHAIVARANETVVVIGGEIDAPAGPVIQFANEAAERRTGFVRAELSGAPLTKIVMPEMLQSVLGQLRQVRSNGAPLESEIRAKDQDGKEYWMEISTIPIFGPEGNVKHFVRIGRDVTARKQAELQREATQRLLAAVFGVIETPLIVTNESAIVMMVNSALTKQLGWSVLDSIGKKLSEIVAPRDRDALKQFLSAFAASGPGNTIGLQLLHRNGTTVQATLQLSLVKHGKGQNFFIVKLDLRPGAGGSSANGVEQRLRNALGADGSAVVVAGKLQLIGLGALREELGPRWSELSDRIFAAADQVIREHLRPGDSSQRSPDDGFLIFFDNLAEAEAKAKAQALGNAIRERLMAELPEDARMEVASFAASITIRSGDVEADGGILEALGSRLEREREQLESGARETVRSGLQSGQVEWQHVETLKGQQAPIAVARVPAALRGGMETLQSVGNVAYSVEADVFLLAGAGQRLLAKGSRNGSTLLIVPVRHATITRARDFESWLRVARTLGEAGKSQIVVEITDIPRDVIRSKLADTAMHLATMFKTTAFELPTTDSSFVVGLPMSTRLATVSVSHISEGGSVAMPAVERLVKALDSRRCRLIVKDCATRPQITALTEGGVKLFVPAPVG